MADYRDGLHLVPAHMRSSVVQWLERGDPHPQGMGEFFRALVCGESWHKVVAYADSINRDALLRWHQFFYNYAPSNSYGSDARAVAWWEAHHRVAVDPADAPVGGEQ